MNEEERAAIMAELNRIPSKVEMDKMLQDSYRKGVALLKTRTPTEIGAPGCWLGGEPTLPASIQWPFLTEVRSGESEIPLHFLAQINLAQLPYREDLPDLPPIGTLFFFYDPAIAPAGDMNQQGGARVIYVQEDVANLPSRRMPKMPKITYPEDLTYWYAKKPTFGYHKWSFQFYPFMGIQTERYRNRVYQQRALDLSLQLQKEFEFETRDRRPAGRDSSLKFNPHHMFASLGRREPDGDLIRLLCLGSDEDLGLDHGGKFISFWIQPACLKKLDFSNTLIFEE